MIAQFNVHPAWCVGLAAVSLSVLKLIWTETSSRAVLGCAFCVSHRAIPHELQWLVSLWGLHLASRFADHRWRWSGAALRALALTLLLLAAVDLVVLHHFFVRLTVGEASKFIGEPQAVRGFVSQIPIAALWAGAVAGALAAWVGWHYVVGAGVAVPRRVTALVGAALAAWLGSAWARVDDFHTVYLHNSTEALFATQSRHRSYSAAFATAVAPSRPSGERCFDGLGARPDVILLIVESLSTYHSQRFSGLEDWMPAFDRASAAGSTFDAFFANGVISEHGMIALLTGEPPIEKGGREGRSLYESFMATADSVPRLLRRADYTTRFISGFNLDFPGMHAWLNAIGFDQVEGQEAAFFAGKSTQRLHFDSVPDELLVDRLLHELALPRTRPLFITAFTQSTHHPYVDPSSGARTQEGAFRYADRALGRFVEGLRAQRFFDKSYLVIVGDHRAMQPMGASERQRFGDRGFARVPMAVLGPGTGGRVSAAFSQTDLLPSLRHLVGNNRMCLSPDQGIFLPSERAAPRCVYSLRNHDPNGVYVHCGPADSLVLLDGDDTRYTGPEPGGPPVLDVIHRLRLGRGF